MLYMTLHQHRYVVRGGDPKFVAFLPRVKPTEVSALDVSDGAAWVQEIRVPAGFAVEALSAEGWTTIHEERLLSQTEGSHPKFVTTLRIRSLLVAPTLTNRPEEWPPEDKWTDPIPCLHPGENLTLEDARLRLLDVAESPGDFSGELLPLVSAHNNCKMFHGSRTLAFLHPIWLSRYNLAFDIAELTSNGQCIARFEEWQEGYEDEVYTRDLLSAGMRLVVRNDWLRMVLRESERALVICTSERRVQRDGYRRPEATSESEGIRLAAYVGVA